MVLPLGILASAGGLAGSMDLISTVIVSGSNANVTFSSIPQTYKHLEIRFVMRDGYNGANGIPDVALNGDFGANYSAHYLRGNGTAASSGSATGTSSLFGQTAISSNINDTANIFGAGIIDIYDYANTSINKTAQMLNGVYANTSGTRIGLLQPLPH